MCQHGFCINRSPLEKYIHKLFYLNLSFFFFKVIMSLHQNFKHILYSTSPQQWYINWNIHTNNCTPENKFSLASYFPTLSFLRKKSLKETRSLTNIIKESTWVCIIQLLHYTNTCLHAPHTINLMHARTHTIHSYYLLLK